jgi:hypothetical protein
MTGRPFTPNDEKRVLARSPSTEPRMSKSGPRLMVFALDLTLDGVVTALWATHGDESRMTSAPARFISDEGMAA